MQSGQPNVQCTLVEQWNGISWNTVSSPNADNGSVRGNSLNAVTVITKDPNYHDIVAAGAYAVSDSDKTLVEYRHDASSSWEVMNTTPLDTYYSNQLLGVATLDGRNPDGSSNDSLDEIWVVGDGYGSFGGRHPIIGHYSFSGGGWQSQPLTLPVNQDAYLSSVDVFATDDVWAVGAYEISNIYYPLIAHWDGGGWSYANALPSITGILSSVFVTKERDIWAVGSNGANTLIMHWYGMSKDEINSKWEISISQNPGNNNQLFAVAALPAQISGPTTSAWAVGSFDNSTLIQGIRAISPSDVNTGFSHSYYVTTIDPNKSHAAGCNAGAIGEKGIAILDFGKPVIVTPGNPPIYGTLLIKGNKAAVDQIGYAAKMFAQGYYEGSTGNHNCPPGSAPQIGPIVIAIGTSNDETLDQPNLQPAMLQHGTIWWRMFRTL